jgi:hypothetical protein
MQDSLPITLLDSVCDHVVEAIRLLAEYEAANRQQGRGNHRNPERISSDLRQQLGRLHAAANATRAVADMFPMAATPATVV